MRVVGEKRTISRQSAKALSVATKNLFAGFAHFSVFVPLRGLLFVFRVFLHRFRGIADAGHFFLLLSSERV
jgi:hypothetical protein